jgi:predicted ATPase
MEVELDFERVGLQGRDAESAALLKAYNASLSSSCSMYVRGASGTGKSTLVRMALQDLDNTLFVQCKFDQQQQGMSKEPFCALALALSELSGLAFALENANLDRDIALLLGDESSFLLKVAPNLQQFSARHQQTLLNEETAAAKQLESPPALPSFPRPATSSKQLAWSSEKLKMDFRAIISVVTTYSAVVIFFDDLQWADTTSIDIIQFFQESQHLGRCLLVGAHRNDISEVHSPLHQQLGLLVETVRASSMCLNNFDLHCLNVIVSSIVRLDTEETMPLTEVVFHKTQGNIFHVVQLLKWIQKPNMLFYSLASLKWEWNLRNIQCGTEMSGDVVRLVGAAFTSQSEDARMRLKVAACLGTQFDAGAIDAMVDAWYPSSMSDMLSKKRRYAAAWEEACSACVINSLSGSEGIRYHFSHDKFQQAAMDLFEEESERLQLHHRIGNFLFARYHQPEATENWMLLAAVDQLNKSIPVIADPKKRHMLAKLNLEAADRIAERSAFSSASMLLKTGLIILGECKWTDHYELTLCMATRSAQFEYCCGRHDICKMRFDEITVHGRSIEDKVDACITYLQSILVQNKAEKALEVGFTLLKQLGFKFPKRPGAIGIIREYTHVRKQLKRQTDDDLVTFLPLMTDRKIQQAVQVLASLIAPALLSDQMKVYALIVIRMTKLTLKYGLTPYSGLAYANFGVILAKRSHLEEAKRMGDLGLNVQDRFRHVDNCMEAETTFIAATTLAHLTRPLHDLLDMELKSHDSAYQIGDLRVVMGASLFYTAAYYHCGLPLHVIMIEDAAKFTTEMEEANLHLLRAECLLYRQAALNLMGRSDDPLLLVQEDDTPPSSNEVLVHKGTAKDYNSKRQVYTLPMMQLCYFMGDLKQAKQMADENMTFKDEDFPFFPATIYPFWRSLIYFSLVRQGQNKYRRKASAQMRIIEGFVKTGIGNCHYMLMILKAEKAAMLFLGCGARNKASKLTNCFTANVVQSEQKQDERSIEIRQMYDDAIKSAARSGFMHGRALANERAGIFALESCSVSMQGWARCYLREARNSYYEWGARVKVKELERRYSLLIGDDEASTTRSYSSHVKGRLRFDMQAKARHHVTDFFQLSSGQSGDECRSCCSFDTNSFHSRTLRSHASSHISN